MRLQVPACKARAGEGRSPAIRRGVVLATGAATVKPEYGKKAGSFAKKNADVAEWSLFWAIALK
jgi:hypothetical protein